MWTGWFGDADEEIVSSPMLSSGRLYASSSPSTSLLFSLPDASPPDFGGVLCFLTTPN